MTNDTQMDNTTPATDEVKLPPDPSVENDDEQEETASSEANEKLIDILDNFVSKIDDLYNRVVATKHLVQTDQYRFASKKARNAIIYGMIYESRDIEELAKVAFRSLKKVKRERISEDHIDELLGIPERMRTQPGKDTEE